MSRDSLRWKPFAQFNPTAPPIPTSVSVDFEVDAAILKSRELPPSFEHLDRGGLAKLRSECDTANQLLRDRLAIARRRASAGIARLPMSRFNEMEDAQRRFSACTRDIMAEQTARKPGEKAQKQAEHVRFLEIDRESVKDRCIAMAQEISGLQARLEESGGPQAAFALAFVEEAKVFLAEQTFGRIGERARERVRRKRTGGE
jgi:hypothetical protein